jgi:hypothetical protein
MGMCVNTTGGRIVPPRKHQSAGSGKRRAETKAQAAALSHSNTESESESKLFPLPDELPPLTNRIPKTIQDAHFLLNRPCYAEYYAAALEATEKQGRDLFIFTGSPGIGKSIFLLYFCERLAREGKADYILMVEMRFKESALLWDNCQKKFERILPNKIDKLLLKLDKEPRAWLLTDGANKGSEYRVRSLLSGKTVWFLSPNKAVIDALCNKCEAKVFYMPEWSLEELVSCNKLLYHIKEEELQERFDLLGGIPRNVFHIDQQRMRINIKNALRESKIMNDLEVLGSQDCFLDEFSHKLLVVHPVGLENYELRFVSPQIEEEVIQHYKQSIPRQFLDFIRVTAGKPMLGGIRGAIFERYAHAVLCQGGTFQVRKLLAGTKKKETVTLEKRPYCLYWCKCKRIIYENDSQGTSPYSRPRSKTQGGFDAFDATRYFQMTVSEYKKVNLAFIEENITMRKQPFPLEKEAVKLFFVVPEDVFDSFTPCSTFEYPSEKVPVWSKNIGQYVLCIPTQQTITKKLRALEKFLENI